MSTGFFGDDMLGSLLTFTMDAVPGAIGAGISVAGADSIDPGGEPGEADVAGRPRSIAAVGVAEELDRAQWDQALGPIWEAFRTGQIVSRPPLDDDGVEGPSGLEALQGLSGTAVTDVRGAVYSAGEYGGELPVILSVYLDRPPDTKALRLIDRWEPMVSQALSMVEFCSGQQQIAEQMLQMTQYRRVIEQAKGLVMAAVGNDADTAFATLARASQHFNVRLRNLAVALVEHVGRGNVEHPPDAELVVTPTEQEREIARRVWAALSTSTAILPPPAG